MRRTSALSRTIAFALVGVVAVLVAGILVPAWRSHKTRQHVNQALYAAEAVKLVVMEAATTTGSVAGIKASDLSYNPSAVTSPYVASVELADGGRITVRTRGTGATPDPILLLVPGEAWSEGAALQWSCSLVNGDPTVAPADCHPKVVGTSN
jgi:type IV pilus assembly protein PilA